MPITINGTGSITGLSAGGLPDLSVQTADLIDGAITTAKVADSNVTASKLSGAQTGSAPIYGARAWVNFNGTGTVAIRGSGNVSSITDNGGSGDYTINFTTAMSDSNYSVVGTATRPSGGGSATFGILASGYTSAPTLLSTTAVRVCTGGGTDNDMGTVSVAVFR